MNIKETLKRKENCIAALVFSALLAVITGLFFDYYFALNDDMLMKDIVAGIYTGTPSGYNIQMLYPLSWALSLLYRLVRTVPWYSLFFLFCQFGCIYLITERILTFFRKKWTKGIALLAEAALLVTLLLSELVFVQYTVTVALLAGTAAFLFYTAPAAESVKDFLKKNTVSIVLAVLAYQMRTEMLLLMLPFICVTGVCRWAKECPVFTKRNFQKYLSMIGLILAGMALSQGVHMIAYGQGAWPEFNRFFDNRTELYDFQTIPPYAENTAFYESIGLTESEYTLLVNYDFGMDEKIDADILGKIAEYAASLKKETEPSFSAQLKKAAWELKYRLLYETDRPYNQVVMVLYIFVLAAALYDRYFHILWELPFLGFVRSCLWLFILYRGRSPERITHSLYLMEIIVLTALLFKEAAALKTQKIRQLSTALILLAVCACCISYTGKSVRAVQEEYSRREEVNTAYESLLSYTKEHPERFYFWDVYSSVAYSEKFFSGQKNTLSNLDIMGGWANKSPLTEKKYGQFGFTSMEEAILTMDNVFVVVKEPEVTGLPALSDWITAYYAEKGINVGVKKADSVYTKDREVFGVYRIYPIL